MQVLVITHSRESARHIFSTGNTLFNNTDVKFALHNGENNIYLNTDNYNIDNPSIETNKFNENFIIATPNRLLNLLDCKNGIATRLDNSELRLLILDGVDKLLSDRYLVIIRRIITEYININVQIVTFSLSMSEKIMKLTDNFMSNTIQISL